MIVLIYNGKNAADDGAPGIAANAYSDGQALFSADDPAEATGTHRQAVFQAGAIVGTKRPVCRGDDLCGRPGLFSRISGFSITAALTLASASLCMIPKANGFLRSFSPAGRLR